MNQRDVFADLVVQGKILSTAKGSDAKLIARLQTLYRDTSKLESEAQEKARELQDLRRQLATQAQTGLVCLEILYDEHGSDPAIVQTIEAAIAEAKGKVPAAPVETDEPKRDQPRTPKRTRPAK